MSSRYELDIDMSRSNNTHTELVRMTGTDRRVLELGAASGYMTQVLRERGCTVTAVEYDAGALDDLTAVADTAVVGDLNSRATLGGIDGPFDVLLAGDVLEHLLDPLTVLRDAVGKLDPHGSVVISVPNMIHCDLRFDLLAGRFVYRPTGLLDATHIRFFTHESLLDMLSEAGLLVAEIVRIIAPPFTTEIGVHRESVSPEVYRAVMAVPDSTTYQFVVRATVDYGDPADRDRARRYVGEQLALAAPGSNEDSELEDDLDEPLDLDELSVADEQSGGDAQSDAGDAAVAGAIAAPQASTSKELRRLRRQYAGLQAEFLRVNHMYRYFEEQVDPVREQAKAATAANEELESTVRELTAALATAEAERAAVEAELAVIRQSRGYRAISALRKFRSADNKGASE